VVPVWSTIGRGSLFRAVVARLRRVREALLASNDVARKRGAIGFRLCPRSVAHESRALASVPGRTSSGLPQCPLDRARLSVTLKKLLRSVVARRSAEVRDSPSCRVYRLASTALAELLSRRTRFESLRLQGARKTAPCGEELSSTSPSLSR
jgi:hypothetical protein